jgi:drug/metabolite transporter (DMT)-like permease
VETLTPIPAAGARPAAGHLGGWLAAIGATAGFSVAAPIASKIIDWGTDPTTTLVLRLWLAAGLLFGTLALAAPDKLRLERRLVPIVLVVGLAMGGAIMLFFWSLTRLDVSIASMLVALEPLMVLFLLRLRGERFTYRNTIRLVLGLGGVYLLVGAQGSADWLGVLMVVVTMMGSAFQTVGLQWFFSGQDGRTITAYLVLIMALTVSAAWVVQGAQWHNPIWQAWVGIGILALVPTYLSRLGLFAAVRRLGSGQVTLLAPLETFLTVIWAVAFLGDRLTAIQLAGGALILLSAVLAVQRLRRAKVAVLEGV